MVTRKTSNIPLNVSDENVSSDQSSSSVSNGVLVFVLILVLAVNCMVLYFVMGYSLGTNSDAGNYQPTDNAVGVRRALLEHEYSKVGGKENYDLIQRASLKELEKNISQIKKYLESDGTVAPPQANTDPVGTLTPDQIATLKKNAAIEGNKDAPILVVEYSDMECPFCMRQYHDTKLWPTLKTQYSDKVSFAYKQNRGVNHKGTEVKALGTLCAQKLGGDNAYVKFYTALMDGSTNEGGVYDVTKLDVLAKSAGVDGVKWKACVDKKETLDVFNAQTAEAQKFGLGGTPGTLILNTKTGKYATVEGAYPYTAFTAKIDAIMK